LEYLINGGKSDRFNLGNGSGFSVREVIETAREVTGRNIVAEEKPRRAGDPPALVGSGDRARQVLGWDPQYADLKTILTHAWAWHLKRHGI
jgi:UDP-glucose 4-epimerase